MTNQLHAFSLTTPRRHGAPQKATFLFLRFAKKVEIRVCRINEVGLRRARLAMGWVTVRGHTVLACD